MLKYIGLLLLFCTSCSVIKHNKESRIVADIPKAKYDIPPHIVVQLESKIDSLPKGNPVKIGYLLRHLGLWDYRHHISSQRRSNVVSLRVDDTSWITFVAEGGPQAITRDEVEDMIKNPRTEWGRGVHAFNVWRIVYNGQITDFY